MTLSVLCCTRGCNNLPMSDEPVCGDCYLRFTRNNELAERKRNAMLGIHSYNKTIDLWFKMNVDKYGYMWTKP